MQVRITPKTKRAKNRVREHGDIFILNQIKDNKIQVQSCTRKSNTEEFWFGWFTKDECDWVII